MKEYAEFLQNKFLIFIESVFSLWRIRFLEKYDSDCFILELGK